MVGCECCLDQNKDNICDKPFIPGSECNNWKCEGYEFWDCVDQEGGGKHFVNMSIKKNNLCDVKCIQDSECNSNQKCRLNNYQCADIKEGDGYCDSDKGENVCIAPNDCKEDNQICCDNEVIDGNCCNISQCKEPNIFCGENHFCTNETIINLENQNLNNNETFNNETLNG